LRLLGFSIPISMVLSLLIILIGMLHLRVHARSPLLGAILQRFGQLGVTAGVAIQVFFLGPLLQYLFAIKFRWFPVWGWAGQGSESSFELSHAVLPVLTLAIPSACLVARSMLGELVHFWSKLSDNRGVLFSHTVLSFFKYGLLQTMGMLGGILFVESAFRLPGIGHCFVRAAPRQDFPLMVGLVYLFLVFALILRALADVVQGLDAFVLPRLKAAEPKAVVRAPVRRLLHAGSLDWIWIAFCLLLVVIPFAQEIRGSLAGGEPVAVFVGRWKPNTSEQDLRSQALYAFGLDLGSSFLMTSAVLIPTLLSGLLAGHLAKENTVRADWLGDLLMFPAEVLASLPGLVLPIFVFGIGLARWKPWVLLGLIFLLPRCARMMRGWRMTASPGRIRRSQVVGTILGILALGTGLAMVSQWGLGFLGLIRPNLGTMLREGLLWMRMFRTPHLALHPGWTMLYPVIGCYLLADALLSRCGIRKREAWLELSR